MLFFRRAGGVSGRLGVLSGTFNPPTRAHFALARAAFAMVDEVLFVLPRVLPHKEYTGAAFEDRIRMLLAAAGNEPRLSIGSTSTGLFIDIARECRQVYGGSVDIYFLCGRDAAERVAQWDYGASAGFLDQLREYRLLVSPRQGAYAPPPEAEGRILTLPIDPEYEMVSATIIRENIRRGEPWEEFVPPEVAPLARVIYGA